MHFSIFEITTQGHRIILFSLTSRLSANFHNVARDRPMDLHDEINKLGKDCKITFLTTSGEKIKY